MENTRKYCPEWRDVLAATHLDDLSPVKREAFDCHLASCSDCTAVLAENQRMDMLLRSAFLPEKPLPSWEELIRRKRDEEPGALPASHTTIDSNLSSPSITSAVGASHSSQGRVAILTAIPVEYSAVRAHLTDIRQEMHTAGTTYERGNFTANNQSWDVLIGETGTGNTRAAVETISIIEYFRPSLMLFVGVAGGLKDVKLNDVVAATKVYGYESGKAGRKFQPRPEVYSSTYRMVHRARAEAKSGDWLQRLEGAFLTPDAHPQVCVAPIASGNQVAASKVSALENLLRSNYTDAVAVEMEGYGFLEALHLYPHIDSLIIRGISDRIDDKIEADVTIHLETAARSASAFAFEILAKVDAAELYSSEPTTEMAVVRKEQQGIMPVDIARFPQPLAEQVALVHIQTLHNCRARLRAMRDLVLYQVDQREIRQTNLNALERDLSDIIGEIDKMRFVPYADHISPSLREILGHARHARKCLHIASALLEKPNILRYMTALFTKYEEFTDILFDAINLIDVDENQILRESERFKKGIV